MEHKINIYYVQNKGSHMYVPAQELKEVSNVMAKS